VLFQDRTATQRAQETGTHPDTVGTLKRRCDAQGMLGLVPETLEVVPAGRRRRVPTEVVHELQRLTGLYEGFGSRELARIILHTLAHRIHHHTVQQLWQELPPAAPPPLPLLDSHRYAERSQARMEGIALSAQGWSKRSISQFLQVSRPTAYSTEFCHPVRRKVATQSTAKLPRNPQESCHPVHGNSATQCTTALPLSERSDAGVVHD